MTARKILCAIFYSLCLLFSGSALADLSRIEISERRTLEYSDAYYRYKLIEGEAFLTLDTS
ncbi:MAG: hypothetical protein RL120_10835 [Gammaproteobacteria bacterium]